MPRHQSPVYSVAGGVRPVFQWLSTQLNDGEMCSFFELEVGPQWARSLVCPSTVLHTRAYLMRHQTRLQERKCWVSLEQG